jgi:mono/diheme cytochrome c family protein/plastocyanin
MNSERAARLLLLAATVGLPLTVLLARRTSDVVASHRVVEIHGTMPESGGWLPGELKMAVGDSLHLRLTSDDVMHGFAVGAFDMDPIDVKPGEFSETVLTFTRPGKYVYYCTRWCGVNHWRMRGTIDVTAEGIAPEVAPPPLYLTLGLDLDVPHPSDILPVTVPSAQRAVTLDVQLPSGLLSRSRYRRDSPVETWRALRAGPSTEGLSDMDVWDLVALAWKRNTTAETLEEGRALYAANCAACHGEGGAGDGVMASALAQERDTLSFGHATTTPADFTDAKQMLGASPALLQGKILRGGMGTGMPYFGPVLTDDQMWAVADYLWTFQYDLDQNAVSESGTNPK